MTYLTTNVLDGIFHHIKVFSLTSAGSFYHAYRVFECLLRSYPNEVFEGLQGDGQLSGRLDSVVRHIGYAPVCELLLMLVALTPLPRSSSIYVACVKQRGLFFDELGRYNLFRRLTEALVQTTSVCHTGAYVGSETHRSAAAQLLQDLVEKLSLEEQGEAWLTPLVAFDAATTQPCSVLQQLLNNMVDRDVDESVRRHCAKVVCFLLKRAAEQDIVCFVAGPNNGPPTASFLPNRLFPLRERIVTAVRDSVPRIVDCLATFDDERSGVAEGARGGDAKLPPFSSLRAYLVEVLALGVESDETVASAISERLWQRLIAWCLRYCGSNIYHALFYRLVFAVLRQGNEGVQRLLFQKARLVSFLVDNFLPYGDNEITGAGFEKGSAAYETRLRRLSVRGLLMNCANAIRLQLTLQPSNSFLPLFLAGLPKWEDFASQLRLATEKQMAFGMGIQVSQVDIKGGNRESAFALLATEAKPNEATLDSSVRFARSLGFLEEGDWTAPHFPSSSSSPDTAVPMPAMTEEHGSRLSYLADDTDDVSELMKALNSHEHGGSGQH